MAGFDTFLEKLYKSCSFCPNEKLLFAMVCVLAYTFIMRILLLVPFTSLRGVFLVCGNLVAAYMFCRLDKMSVTAIMLYLGAVVGLFLLTRTLAVNRYWWVAATAPIVLLVFAKYSITVQEGFAFSGISYMAFRLSQLVVTVRTGLVSPPGIVEYLAFAFFAPTLEVGPISSYATFHSSYQKPDWPMTPVGRSLVRIIIGASKIVVLGSIFDQLSYAGLLLDNHPHPISDLAIAVVSYYLFLYCNFSGYCDVAVGVSRLLGFKVSENFDAPLSAGNIQEFWQRWHITLSTYMRDLVFTPVSKALTKRLPRDKSHLANAITIILVYLLIGIWHGSGLNFVLFGLIHGVGMVCHFYYRLMLKARLSEQQLKDYTSSWIISGAARVITFIFVACSQFAFANTIQQMQEIWRAVS